MDIRCGVCFGSGKLVITLNGNKLGATRCPNCSGTGIATPLDDMPDEYIRAVCKKRFSDRQQD